MASLGPKGEEQPRAGWGEGSLKWNAKRQRWIVTIEGNPDPVTGDRRRLERSAKTKPEAVRLKNELEKAKELKRDITPKSTKLKDWLHEWLEGKLERGLRPTTYRSYKSAIDNGINPRIGGVQLTKLSGDHVSKMTDSIVRDGGTRNAARYAHTILAMALADAKRARRVSENVAGREGPKKPSVKKKKTPRLNAKQAMEFLEACRLSEQGDFSRWAFALITGTRQGETIGLTWDRLDLETGEANLEWQLQSIPNEHGCGKTSDDEWKCRQKVPRMCPKKRDLKSKDFEYIHLTGSTFLTKPKTADSERMTPIPLILIDYLKDHRNATADQPNPHNLVWHQKNGAPLQPRKDHARWKEILKLAGLPTVKLHSARHTAGTVLASLGMDVDMIRRVLGHTSIDMTAIYSDVDREVVRGYMDQMSGKIILGEVTVEDPKQLPKFDETA